MDNKEFFYNQLAYCYSKRRKDGFVHCDDCVMAWNCIWKEKYNIDTIEYCENFTHIEDTYPKE